MKKNYGTFTFIQRILQTPKKKEKKRTEIHKTAQKEFQKLTET